MYSIKSNGVIFTPAKEEMSYCDCTMRSIHQTWYHAPMPGTGNDRDRHLNNFIQLYLNGKLDNLNAEM